MQKGLLALLLLICVCQVQGRSLLAKSSDVGSDPWFCHDLDCPKFKVLNTTEKYQIREYESARWASTKVESLLYSVAVSEGFKRLFDYISGKNEGNQKIAMTVPVAVNVVPGQGPFCKSFFTVNFFLPYNYQNDPPKPSNPEVSITKSGKVELAVSQFGGFVVDDFTVSAKADSLKKALEADSVSYNGTSFFVTGYDPPFRLQHRHNEIWIVLDPESQIVA